MDVAEFEHWLTGAAALSFEQRRRTWETLALCEALDDGGFTCGNGFAESVHDAGGGMPLPDTGRLGPASPAEAVPRRTGVDLVAELGQQRIGQLGCPHCGHRETVRWGRSDAMPRYRCKSCRRTFNALTNTPLARLRMKDKWRAQAEALIDGVTTAKAAERCGVDYKTAFRWRHRFLKSLAGDKPSALSGIVEGDEMFILESFKGKRSDLPRKVRKRGGKSARRGLSAEQIPVIAARGRHGATTDAVLPKLDRASIAAALGGAVTPASEFCCDGGSAIVAFARRAGIPTHILPAPGKPNPRAPDFHINNVNAYHDRLKEWLRRFHGVATKNLPNYLGWRRTLEAFGDKATAERWILGAFGIGPYQRVTG